jgi:excinuclease ABC subunit C
MSLTKDKKNSLPENAGVYAFRNKGTFLYIGKAINIRKRVKSHFYHNESFIKEADEIAFIETESEIEALLLESELIKKYRPLFNIAWKDGKNYFYVNFTEEKPPYVFVTHRITRFGPFVDGKALRRVLRLYEGNLKNLKLTLSGRKAPASQGLKRKMKKASEEENFERAAELRDRLFSLKKIILNAKIISRRKYSQKDRGYFSSVKIK